MIRIMITIIINDIIYEVAHIKTFTSVEQVCWIQFNSYGFPWIPLDDDALICNTAMTL